MKKGKLFFVTDSDGKLIELIGVYVDEKSIEKGAAEFKVATKFSGANNVPKFEDITIFGGRKSNAEDITGKPVKKSEARKPVKKDPVEVEFEVN